MSRTWNLRAGADIVYDGEPCTVAEVCDGAVIVRSRSGRIRRLRMIDVLRPASDGGLAHIPGRTRAEEEAVPLGRVDQVGLDPDQGGGEADRCTVVAGGLV